MDITSDSKFEDNPLLSVPKTDNDRDKALSNLKPKYKGKSKKRETSKKSKNIQTKSLALPPVSSILSNDHKTVIPLHQEENSLYMTKHLEVDPKDIIIHDLDSQDEDQESNRNDKMKSSISHPAERQELFEMDKEKIYKYEC